MGVCQNLLGSALDAGSQKDRPYQSDFYRAGFNAIPRGAREQDSFDTPPFSFCGYLSPLTIPVSVSVLLSFLLPPLYLRPKSKFQEKVSNSILEADVESACVL